MRFYNDAAQMHGTSTGARHRPHQRMHDLIAHYSEQSMHARIMVHTRTWQAGEGLHDIASEDGTGGYCAAPARFIMCKPGAVDG